MWELKIKQYDYSVEAEQTRGEPEDGLLAIALRRFQLQVFTAFLERGFDRPTLCVTLYNLLRRHGDVCGEEILVTVSPCAIMDV